MVRTRNNSKFQKEQTEFPIKKESKTNKSNMQKNTKESHQKSQDSKKSQKKENIKDNKQLIKKQQTEKQIHHQSLRCSLTQKEQKPNKFTKSDPKIHNKIAQQLLKFQNQYQNLTFTQKNIYQQEKLEPFQQKHEQIEYDYSKYLSKQQNKRLNQLKRYYSFCQDENDRNRIVSCLQYETFTVILSKYKNKPIELLQEIRSIEKLIQKNVSKIRSLSNMPSWSICESMDLKNESVKKIISAIKESYYLECLKLLDHPESLNIFSHIRFSSLQRLNLIGTKITNIQALTWLDCPNIQQIHINESMVTSIKPLNKTNFSTCYRLSIKNYKCSQPNLDRMKFSREYNSSISLTRSKRQRSWLGLIVDELNDFQIQMNVEDIKTMCKTEGFFDTLQKSYYSRQMIKQPKAFLALKRKQNISQSDIESEPQEYEDQQEQQISQEDFEDEQEPQNLQSLQLPVNENNDPNQQ